MASTACGSGGRSRHLSVFAAASLTDPFQGAAAAFERQHSDVDVRFNFAGSPTLRAQLAEGAGADVLATADEDNMDAARQRGLVAGEATVFARNRLTVIVPKSNPAGITSPGGLARPGVRLVLAQEDVPAGRYARDSLAKMEAGGYGAGFRDRVLANVVSDEPNVKAVVAKVQLGEADAGIVYVTDVTPSLAKDMTAVAIPDQYNVVADYPVAVTASSHDPALARMFVDFLLSDEGQQALERDGFMRVR